jgi:poly-gamma-glutamate synthesis protein (capsule biosynthesis protein)
LTFLAAAEREFNFLPDRKIGVNVYAPVAILEQIEEIRERTDFLFLVLHCNKEHVFVPRPELYRELRFLAKHGVDAIVCHHSHCLAPLEYVGNVPIFFGLGNFLFPAEHERGDAWHLGGMARICIEPDHTLRAECMTFFQCKNALLEFTSPPEGTSHRGEDGSERCDREAEYDGSWMAAIRMWREGLLLDLVWPLNGGRRLLLRSGLARYLLRLIPTPYLLRVLNRLRCPSHREATVAAIEIELNQRGHPS